MWARKRPVAQGIPARAQVCGHQIHQGLGGFGRSRLREGGAAAPPHVAAEGELADHQGRPADLHHRAVHAALVVGEDPQAGQLVGQGGGVGRPVAGGRPHQHQQPAADLADRLAVDPDRSPGDSLHHCPHGASRPASLSGS